MKKIEFNPSQADIAAEIEHLTNLGIDAYSAKHVVLYPAISDEKEINGPDGQKTTIKIDKGTMEQMTKDLDIFFPVVLVGARAATETSRILVNAGDFIMPEQRQNVVKGIPLDVLKPLLAGAVYGLVEDYSVELVKRRRDEA